MKGSTASHPQLQRCLRHDQIPRKQVTKHHDSWFLPEQRNRFTLGLIPWDACMKPPGDYVSYLGRGGGNSQITPVGWSVGPFVALCASSSSILEKAKSLNGFHLQLTEALWLEHPVMCRTKMLFNHGLSSLGSMHGKKFLRLTSIEKL